jgi:hypothetical protein
VSYSELKARLGVKRVETNNLARKKAEQADARNAIKQEKSQAFAAGGAAGQQGGPANPVGKNNYPNTGSG